ncbi:paaF domain protein [Burkholderia pseudomallei A79D]|nr:paaF domain protein [Burkholderia pseudomallei MSHR5608]KGS19430.1 paaF domain protein [Burkholderia pseudomallei MSHR7343]KGS72656.1 paaF domain protein [Burkholderia pseudomallei MSHR5596]KGS73267.1 paaF domain protein [Burkholderia pseudomallei MSHR7334]KGW37928.1 paaF domain protein [Burkholderia pseudomallei MSHR3016]KGX50577.1 paaF domain protein [Burkholderia pseudomallei TSV44]KGX94201.1 paaF domain protein [Burkholderia pseudomallei A79D]
MPARPCRTSRRGRMCCRFRMRSWPGLDGDSLDPPHGGRISGARALLPRISPTGSRLPHCRFSRRSTRGNTIPIRF